MALLGNATEDKPKKKLNKGKIFKISIIVILIILFISLIILYENNNDVRNFFDIYIFRKIINEENVSSIDIGMSKDINIFAYDKYLAVLEQNELKLYNKSGNQETSLELEISNPIYATCGNYICIAENKGKKLYLISNKNIVWQKDIEGIIDSVNVNKNGYVAVTISGTSYKSVIETFEPNGDELFKKYLATTNAIATDISNDNKYLAIAQANFSGIVIQSSIEIISIEDAKNNSNDSIKYTYVANADDLIINIKYNNKNDLVCMYDQHIDIFKDGQNTELVNLHSQDTMFADINVSSKIIQIVKTQSNVLDTIIELQIINSNNINDIHKYTIEKTPKQIYTQGNMIAINLGTSVIFINDNGWLVKKYESKQGEIQNIVMCDEIAGIISKNKINIISL